MKVANQIVSEFQQKYSKEYSVGDLEKYEDIKITNKTLEKFNKRGLCTGNTRVFYVLPDGKITFCEQMYWSPNFIIGDITNLSSI
jgi:sulfatase maturation enzyme AslB (radical SAM superfamily)